MIITAFINNCPIQLALVNRIRQKLILDKVFCAKNIIKDKKRTLLYFSKRLIRFPFELSFRMAWNELKKTYLQEYTKAKNKITVTMVSNINDRVILEYIKNSKPSLIIVSATTLIQKEIIDEAKKIDCLILNLHTGISPYVKGGPNCTNWCLATNNYLIGNTVMRLDEGIDSGNIIATEQTTLQGNETLFALHHKVMEHGFELYLKVILCYVLEQRELKAIPQDRITEHGQVFYTKEWTISKVIRAYYNYIFFYQKGIQTFVLKDSIQLFPFICKEG